jgi:SAM-dependent methyltransferase
MNCDLVYAPSPPSAAFLSKAYSEAAYDSGQEALFAAQSYARALTKHIAHLPGRKAAIDIGAGSGPLLPWLRECGFSPVIGIEPSRSAIAAAPPDIRPMLREGMFSPALIDDTRPSFLCSFMTLEHMDDPIKFVSTAYDALEPGGMLALVVHNWRAPLNRILGFHSPIIDIEHLQLFSPQSLEIALAQVGFTSISIQTIKNTYSIRYWLRLSPLPVPIKLVIARALDSLGISNFLMSIPTGNLLAIGSKQPHSSNSITNN